MRTVPLIITHTGSRQRRVIHSIGILECVKRHISQTLEIGGRRAGGGVFGMVALAQTFDARAARLNKAVLHSEASLAALHRSNLDRSIEQLRTISSNVTSLRSQLAELTADLQPRLDRLASGENQRSAALHQRSSVPSIRIDPSASQIQAAKQLQAVWRTHQMEVRTNNLLPSKADESRPDHLFCPVVLRRALVDGRRLPSTSFCSAGAARAPTAANLPELQPPEMAKRLPAESSQQHMGERHFMSIL